VIQQLDLYQTPSDWTPGVNRLKLTLWFCLGSPLLANRWLPGSAWRILLLRIFGAKIGMYCRVKPGFRVKFPWRLSIGNACWLAEDAWIDNLAPVLLGDRVCISQSAYFCTGNHDYRSPLFDLRLAPIRIDDDVWVAAKAVLGPGSTVGCGAVVGLGAVVTGEVRPGAVMRGNPAKVVGTRSQNAEQRPRSGEMG
jgi:putative colanic acid biosynthesis acetyltransferase WcaF